MARNEPNLGDTSNTGSPAAAPKVRLAKAAFTDLVLVCSKCAKRQHLKKGALRRTLKRGAKDRAGDRTLRIVEVGCLGPCPKRALAVATSDSLARRRILLLDPAAGGEAMVAALFPDFGPKAPLTPGRARLSNDGAAVSPR